MNERENIELNLKVNKDVSNWINQQVDVSASIRAAVLEFIKNHGDSDAINALINGNDNTEVSNSKDIFDHVSDDIPDDIF